ncbi:hypothetical protein [Rhodopseudomonas palustris]
MAMDGEARRLKRVTQAARRHPEGLPEKAINEIRRYPRHCEELLVRTSS